MTRTIQSCIHADPDARWVNKGSKASGLQGLCPHRRRGLCTGSRNICNKGPANKAKPACATMSMEPAARLGRQGLRQQRQPDMLCSRHRDGITGKGGGQGCAGAPSAGFGKAFNTPISSVVSASNNALAP